MIAGAVVATIAAVWASAAAADKVTDAEHQYAIDVPSSWTPVDLEPPPDEPVGPTQVAAWSAGDGSIVVTRIDGPTHAAWRGKRDYFDSYERGIKRAVTDYERIDRDRSKLGRIPTLDLWYRGDGRAVAMRTLFFRRYALVLAIAVPAGDWRAHRRMMRRLVRSFVPYFGD